MLLIAILLCIGAFNALALPIEKAVEDEKSYFLPEDVVLPTNYKVTIDVSESFKNLKEGANPEKFSGEVVIKAEVNANNINEIVLHAANITIQGGGITVVDQAGTNLYKEHDDTDTERQFLKIKTTKPLYKGNIITITINFEGILRDDMNGFYVSKYDDDKDPTKTKYVLTTQFQPTHARKAFPCFDEPKYKATFELTFKCEEQYSVISNMVPDPENIDQNTHIKTVSFPVTPKMSTYLIAFIVHQFEVSTTEKKNYNVWSRPGAKDQTRWATKYMYPIVEDLNKFTGINYEEKMAKMDMAALPDFSAGAMENWGLLTYRETALLVDDEKSTDKDIQRVVSVISHEIAHQWFGNLITLTWWRNTWLNEGFARYFEYHTTGNVLPDWEMKEQFVVEQQQVVFGVDALAKSTPLTLEVYTPSQISSHFGSISYNKGGSVIRMMENFLGSDNFQLGLQNYLKNHELQNTEPEDLWSALQFTINNKNVLEYPLESIMSTWISQAGYPVVNVNLDSSGYVEISQQRFYLNPNENTGKASEQLWYVPISYTTSKDKDFKNLKPKLWLTPKEPKKIISIDDSDFLIVNIQEAGYYRVNYNSDLWNKIAGVLHEDSRKDIHYMNKAQIVDDVLNLARAGIVHYEIAFNITDYLKNEDNYFPWYSTFQDFKFLLQRYSDTDDTGVELRGYLKSLMELLLKDKEFDEVKDESHIAGFNRAAALDWACNLGHEKCVQQAQILFKDFKDGQRVYRNWKATVYCTALRYGTKDDWDFLWKKFGESDSAADKIGIINALGCSNDTEILTDFLQKSIDPKSGIRRQDASYVFTSVYNGNTIGVDVAFEFLKENHENMIIYYNGLNDLEKAVLGLAGRLTDEKQMADFKAVLKSNDNYKNFRDAAIETMDENKAWASKYNDVIGEILKKKRTKGTAAGIIANKYMILFLGFISIYFSIFN